MNIPKVSSLILTSVLVAACSGGGGGGNNGSSPEPEKPINNTQSLNQDSISQGSENSDSAKEPTPTPTPTPTPPTTDLPNSDITISKDDYSKGKLTNIPVTEDTKLSGYNRQYSFNGALVKVQESNIGDVGVKWLINQFIEELELGGLKGEVLNKTLVSFYNATTKDPVRDVFYFGYETPESNIPVQGVVTYKGNASRYDNVSASVKNIGDSELIADFNTKTIKGELDMTYPRRNITLNETPITGNGFNGKAVTEANFPFLISREGVYEGKFYGPNAEEVAGKATFDDSVKDLNTSFSAVKQ